MTSALEAKETNNIVFGNYQSLVSALLVVINFQDRGRTSTGCPPAALPITIGAGARYHPCRSTATTRIYWRVTSDATVDPDPLEADEKYHTASVKCNKRTTAEDWFQDVRHFEFSFKEDIKYGSWSFLSATAYPELQIQSWRCRCGSSACSCVRS